MITSDGKGFIEVSGPKDEIAKEVGAVLYEFSVSIHEERGIPLRLAIDNVLFSVFREVYRIRDMKK